MNERVLHRAILGAIAAALPVGGGVVACGDAGSSDGGSDANDEVPCICCGLPPPVDYTVTYTLCAPTDADAPDADDAGTDAAVADAAANVCYDSCFSACQATAPANQTIGGFGSCVGDIDGGDGGVRVAQCEILHACGRRLDGLEEPSTPDLIAHAAWLEAASIHAFRRLSRELEAHGAPPALVRRARACARDEARHARIMARIAHRRGVAVPRVVVRSCDVRDLESIARENAIEGCARGRSAPSSPRGSHAQPRTAMLRKAMMAIAPDEPPSRSPRLGRRCVDRDEARRGSARSRAQSPTRRDCAARPRDPVAMREHALSFARCCAPSSSPTTHATRSLSRRIVRVRRPVAATRAGCEKCGRAISSSCRM